jgi:hypothetical protein
LSGFSAASSQWILRRVVPVVCVLYLVEVALHVDDRLRVEGQLERVVVVESIETAVPVQILRIVIAVSLPAVDAGEGEIGGAYVIHAEIGRVAAALAGEARILLDRPGVGGGVLVVPDVPAVRRDRVGKIEILVDVAEVDVEHASAAGEERVDVEIVHPYLDVLRGREVESASGEASHHAAPLPLHRINRPEEEG